MKWKVFKEFTWIYVKSIKCISEEYRNSVNWEVNNKSNSHNLYPTLSITAVCSFVKRIIYMTVYTHTHTYGREERGRDENNFTSVLFIQKQT